MGARILTPEQGAQHQAPNWRQTGLAPSEGTSAQWGARSDRSKGATASGDEIDEATQLRGRIAELEASIPMAVEQARRDTRRAVEAEAAQAAAKLADQHARSLATAAADLIRVRGHMRRQMEEDLVRLALVVARRVVRRELTVDPEALLGIARAAIEQIEAREMHRVRVSQREAEMIKKFLMAEGLPAQVAVVGDAALEAGSLIFETARGTIDASVEVQLAEIDRGLADVLRRSA